MHTAHVTRLALLVAVLSVSSVACGRRGQPQVVYGGDANLAGGMQAGYGPGAPGAPIAGSAAPVPVAPVPAPGVANFGAVQMVAGFLPDPITVRGTAGTGQNAARLGRATSGRCRGTVAQLPDYVFDVGAPFEYLRFQAMATADTVMAVRGPQGLSCDDDGAGDRNPRVEGPFPAGRYEVWIGAANRRANGTPYELTVTTFRADQGGAIVAPSNAANFGEMRIARGFDAQRARARGTSGAAIDAEDLGQSLTGRCRGWIAARPDHLVTLTTAFDYLRLEAAAGQDTTLVVRGPQGLMCDDDGAGNHNPRIEGAFGPGVYQVWIGSFRRGRQAPYELLFLPAPAGQGVPAAPTATAVAMADPAPPARPARPARPERPARPSRPNITVNIQAAPPAPPPQQVWVQAEPVQQPQQVWVQPHPVQQPQPAFVQAQPVQQPQQQSNFGTVRLATGFEPDPWAAQGTSGGEISAEQSFGCQGWIDSRPDHILDLRTGFDYLRVEATSNADTTLVVRGPGGVFCDDDSAGGRNPRLEGQWAAGRYEVWIGSYQQGVMSRYQVVFSELRGAGAPVASAPAAPAPPPSPDCISLSRMVTLASLGGADVGPIETRMRLACNQGVAMGERENWPNGATLRSSGGTWYFPNGATAFSSGGTWYYANGATAVSSGGTWYFPNGATALSSGGTWYAPDGTQLGSEGAFLAWACGALGEYECNSALGAVQNMDPLDRMLVIVSLGARATR